MRKKDFWKLLLLKKNHGFKMKLYPETFHPIIEQQQGRLDNWFEYMQLGKL